MKLKAVHRIIRKKGIVEPNEEFDCSTDEANDYLALGAAVEVAPAKPARKTKPRKAAEKEQEAVATDGADVTSGNQDELLG